MILCRLALPQVLPSKNTPAKEEGRETKRENKEKREIKEKNN